MKKEKLLFYTCILLNALPILLFRFFPSMDGPAHLYNANILRQLWLGQSEVLQQWYAVNPALIPNWTSHFLLAVFGLVLPAFLAEKLLLLLYVIGLPLAFRGLVTRLAPGQKVLVYLIFPFVYHYLFCLGFYNLALSIILLFAGLSITVQQIRAPTTRGWIAQAVLFTATYFTHPFSFTLLVLGASGIWAVQFLTVPVSSAKPLLQRFQSTRSPLWRLSLACLLPMALLVHFYMTQHFYNSGVRLSTNELLLFLKDVRPIIAYHYERELRLTEYLFPLFVSLSAIAFYIRINNVSGQGYGGGEKWRKLFRPNDLWLGLAVLLLVLLFLVSNSASAGMMSDRFALFFFVFWLIWLAVQPFPRWLVQAATTVVLLVNFGLLYRHIRVIKDLNKLAQVCEAVGREIPAGSMVLPLNYSGNWLAPHFSNYLGIEKPLVILENYETDTGWFPLLWQKPRPQVQNEANSSTCLPFHYDSTGTAVQVDYVFILGKINQSDSCQALIKHLLDQDYDQLSQSTAPETMLYKRKE